jgi:mannan polymerase II complex MNN10 subunit
MREAEAFFDEKLGVAVAQQQAEQEEREKREQEEHAEREAKEKAEREAAELKEKEERERMMAVAMQKRRSMRRKITENFIFF